MSERNEEIEKAAFEFAGQQICPLNGGIPVTPYEINMVKMVAYHFMAGVVWQAKKSVSTITKTLLTAL